MALKLVRKKKAKSAGRRKSEITKFMDDVESVQWHITVTALSDVPGEDTVTVVVVGGLGPRTGTGNVTSA